MSSLIRIIACTATLVLSIAARAGEPKDADAIAKDVLAAAAQEASACDDAVEKGDAAAWQPVARRFLARLAELITTLEVTAADPNVPEEKLVMLAKVYETLTRARFGYGALVGRAVDPVSGRVDAERFGKFRERGRLATMLVEVGPGSVPPKLARQATITKSADNVKSLLLYFIADGAGVSKGWPPYSGKRFILWLVATNNLDRRDARQLRILFSYGDATRSLDAAGGVDAFAKLSKDSLADPALDLSKLTSYVGRRNAEKAHLLTADEMRRGAPVIADLSIPDVAIVGFVTGEVKVMTREDLGLGPNDPIVAGDKSKSPVLRDLSDE